MKALVYTGVETLEYLDFDDPVADSAADEVLIRIESVGICGSDMHAFLGHDERRPAPLILGHEGAGVVVGGSDDGRRVTVNPLVTCGQCKFCGSERENLCQTRQIISMPPREGAFAQYLKMPRANLVTVPDNVSFDKACLAEPIACGWHAGRLAQSALNEPFSQCNALVIGGGAIGVGAALALKCQGIGSVVVVEPNALRRDFLLAQGELDVRSPDELDSQLMAQLAIDCVGYPATRQQASALVEPGGVIMHIGLGNADGGLDIRRMTLQEITFIGTYTYTPHDFRATANAIFDGSLGKLEWIETRALADGAAAFADIRQGVAAAPKIVLKPWS